MADPSSLGCARSRTLMGLADALTTLAARMRARESAARDFVRLVVRAERIASQAYLLNTSKGSFEGSAKALAAELAAFAASVAEAAARVKAEANGNAAIADALATHADRITQIAPLSNTAASSLLREELQPLQATLTTLHGQTKGESTVTQASDALAERASILAATAYRLTEGGRHAASTAMAIHQALRGFVNEAGSISQRMSNTSAGLGLAADQMASHTRELSGGQPTPATPAEDIVWHST